VALTIRLDSGGIGEMLRSDGVRGVIDSLAESVAGNVNESSSNGDSIPVEVSSYTTDRAAAGVTMAHPAGLALEAKYGPLAKAAASVGLEVRAR
jgi:hypothetical protein